MKHLFSIALIALSTTAIAQPEQTPPAPPALSLEEAMMPPVQAPDMYMNAAEQVKMAINNNPEAIGGFLSEDIMRVSPPSMLIDYVKAVKKQYGEARELRFVTLDGGVAQFEIGFDKNARGLMKLGVSPEGRLTSLNISQYKEENRTQVLERNTTVLALPVNGEWYILSGGVADPSMRGEKITSFQNRAAVTFSMLDADKKAFKTNGNTNEDYMAFGQPVLAPCDATVVKIIDNIDDNEPGSVNTTFAGGNTLVLKTDKNEYLVFGHLKKASIKVKEGDKVKKGATLAMVGNSGDCKQPSLFFNVQNTDGSTPAIGCKIIFSNVVAIMPDGKTENKKIYTPLMGGKVKSN
ncbi:MAG: M23 family metallopeptidase [Sphingobacteriales bacterium]|nr:MAG: M23 family metallopeptidase [Sphingobacteriales bacterium]